MKIIITYFIISFIFGIILDIIAKSNIGLGDKDYDEAMLNSVTRIIAILIISFCWIVTLPMMIINNYKEA